MKALCVTIAAVGLVFTAAGVRATPPGPGQHFDCSDGAATSCAADDPGCVSNTVNHLKCSRKIGRLFAKAIVGTIKCHADQATMRFKGASVNGAGNSEENCEENPGMSAKGQLDTGLSKLSSSGLCDPTQLSNASAEEATLFGGGPGSLDAQNGNVFCDATSGTAIGDDDTGSVPATADNLKCAITVGKNVSRLIFYTIKCHEKMNKAFFGGIDFDEESCEETNPSQRGALDKYNHQRDKLVALGICPSCLDGPSQDTLASNALAQVEAANDLVYPCNLGP